MKHAGAIKTAIMWTVGVALLALIVAFLAGVFRTKVEPGQVAQVTEPSPPFARFEAVRAQEETLEEKVPGTLSALRESLVSARIMARIEQIEVRAGDLVNQGQVLVRLDDRDLGERRTQASQATQAAQARLAETRKEYERMEKLLREGIVSQSEFDSAQAAYRTAQAEVARAEAATREAGTGQGWATITAPLTGRVVDRYAEPGDTATPGQALLKIYDPTQMRLETYVRESLAATLRPGMALDVQIDALGTSVQGTIQEIVPQSEAGSRSMLVKVALPQREDLYPGMFGRLLIPAGQTRRLYVPREAVKEVGQLHYVWIVDTNKNQPSVRRFIKLGNATQDAWVQVISGLEEGETVGIEESGK